MRQLIPKKFLHQSVRQLYWEAHRNQWVTKYLFAYFRTCNSVILSVLTVAHPSAQLIVNHFHQPRSRPCTPAVSLSPPPASQPHTSAATDQPSLFVTFPPTPAMWRNNKNSRAMQRVVFMTCLLCSVWCSQGSSVAVCKAFILLQGNIASCGIILYALSSVDRHSDFSTFWLLGIVHVQILCDYILPLLLENIPRSGRGHMLNFSYHCE